MSAAKEVPLAAMLRDLAERMASKGDARIARAAADRIEEQEKALEGWARAFARNEPAAWDGYAAALYPHVRDEFSANEQERAAHKAAQAADLLLIQRRGRWGKP